MLLYDAPDKDSRQSLKQRFSNWGAVTPQPWKLLRAEDDDNGTILLP